MISVNRDVKGNSGVVPIAISEITYLEFEKSINRIIVHTRSDRFYTVGTLKYWANTLECSGYDFVLADRNTLIHVSNIFQIDRTFHIAYFGDNLKGEEQKCFLSERGYEKVTSKIRKLQSDVKFIELPSW